MNISEKMKRDWNQRAQHHARFWIATENYQTEEIFAQSGEASAQALLTALNGLYRPSWKVLDIGCGIGRVLKPLAKHFHSLVGVDVSSTMIAQSKVWLSECPHVITLETSGVDLYEFDDQCFDLVYSYVAFQHMPRPVFEQYLSEISRVLTPKGYLALQVPIGLNCDSPLEDTIGIRSYPMEEIQLRLQSSGLAFVDQPILASLSTDLAEPFDHRFHVVQKVQQGKPVVATNWVQLEHPNRSSPLDIHLYEMFADNCVKFGKPHEGIQTLQYLVNRNPEHLTGWLKLAALLLETGQVQEALTTMQHLTTLHPCYQEGQAALEHLLSICNKTSSNTSQQTTDHQGIHERATVSEPQLYFFNN